MIRKSFLKPLQKSKTKYIPKHSIKSPKRYLKTKIVHKNHPYTRAYLYQTTFINILHTHDVLKSKYPYKAHMCKYLQAKLFANMEFLFRKEK